MSGKTLAVEGIDLLFLAGFREPFLAFKINTVPFILNSFSSLSTVALM